VGFAEGGCDVDAARRDATSLGNLIIT
jgi:hypothetical protein